jgi:hypothetical protein
MLQRPIAGGDAVDPESLCMGLRAGARGEAGGPARNFRGLSLLSPCWKLEYSCKSIS